MGIEIQVSLAVRGVTFLRITANGKFATARLKVNGKIGVRFLDFRTALKNVLLMAKWNVVIRVHNTYVI